MWRKGYNCLYHGASLSRLEFILEKGLIPRDESGVPDHYPNTRHDVVYLTPSVKYARAYGMMDNKRLGKPIDEVMIVEVEVKDEDLIPDESFLETVGRDKGLHHIKTGAECLAVTGHVAHKGGISLEYIRRIYEIDVDSLDEQRLFYIGEFLQDCMIEAGLPLPKLHPPPYNSYKSQEQDTLLSRIRTRLKARFLS